MSDSLIFPDSLEIKIAGVKGRISLYEYGVQDFARGPWLEMRDALQNLLPVQQRALEARTAFQKLTVLGGQSVFQNSTNEHPTLTTRGIDYLTIICAELAGILMEAEPSPGNCELFYKLNEARERTGFTDMTPWTADMKTIAQIAFNGSGVLPAEHLRRDVPDESVVARGYHLLGRVMQSKGEAGKALGAFEEAGNHDERFRGIVRALQTKPAFSGVAIEAPSSVPFLAEPSAD